MKSIVSDSIAFANSLAGDFDRAVQRAGLVERYFQIGTHAIRIRFAGDALVSSMTSALAHVMNSVASYTDGEFDGLTLSVFDSESTGIPLSEFPFSSQTSSETTERWYGNQGGCHVYFQQGVNALQVLNLHNKQAIYWVPSVEQIPYYVVAAPFLATFHWWFGSKGGVLIHGGAVGDREGGVMLTGKGGSGKSTSVLSCLDSQLKYAGDDYCLLATHPEPHVYSLYNSAKLEPSNRDRFPQLNGSLWKSDQISGEKTLFLLHPRFAEKFISDFPLKAILLPRVMGQKDTTVEPVHSAEAVRALAPTSVIQLPGARHVSFGRMTEIVKRVPSFRLKSGLDLKQIPRTIEALLTRIRNSPQAGFKKEAVRST